MPINGKVVDREALHGEDLRLISPASAALENGNVAPPHRRANRELRHREHLTPSEVERLMIAIVGRPVAPKLHPGSVHETAAALDGHVGRLCADTFHAEDRYWRDDRAGLKADSHHGRYGVSG
jgi:hypothetical protein